jgi:FkbM family methyltransferase
VGKSLELMGEYSPMEFTFLGILSDPRKIALDVGANIGALTIPLSYLNKQVLAFEPIPFTNDLLKANVALCNRKNINILRLAATDKACRLCTDGTEHNFKKDLGGVQLTKHKEGHIEGRSIDSIVKKYRDPIGLVKLDIEGGEANAIRGMHKTIEKDEPYIFFEAIHESTVDESIEVVKDTGYEMRWFISMMYEPTNHKGCTESPWPGVASFNIIAWPKAKHLPIFDMLPTLDKVKAGAGKAQGKYIVQTLG